MFQVSFFQQIYLCELKLLDLVCVFVISYSDLLQLLTPIQLYIVVSCRDQIIIMAAHTITEYLNGNNIKIRKFLAYLASYLTLNVTLYLN